MYALNWHANSNWDSSFIEFLIKPSFELGSNELKPMDFEINWPDYSKLGFKTLLISKVGDILTPTSRDCFTSTFILLSSSFFCFIFSCRWSVLRLTILCLLLVYVGVLCFFF